ncbi:hypothetical protein K432DRAFT_105094 [Lepidopterella palustris CBS 459.81]|uniref:Uncharacterized protein n=1 Tax=Lepidopterella palustris CBS 459.81 TaxID=1314670 RepID=A0A8E2JD12_9PEZI|nr:hypothetical protein K432DRAFT_105094 [Lepidopterella palustris CBS 459.81]
MVPSRVLETALKTAMPRSPHLHLPTSMTSEIRIYRISENVYTNPKAATRTADRSMIKLRRLAESPLPFCTPQARQSMEGQYIVAIDQTCLYLSVLVQREGVTRSYLSD